MNDVTTAVSERIALLDILRGIAVLGIFWVNVVYFGQPYSAYNFPTLWGEAEQANILAWIITNLWVEDAMRALFAMLFGASTTLLLADERLHDTGIRGVDYWFRRNLWLMALGAAHAHLLLSPHDVLFVYGLLGLLLLPLRRSPPLVLALLGLILLAVGVVSESTATPSTSSNSPTPLHLQRASPQEVTAFRHGLQIDMQADVEIYQSGYREIFAAQKISATEAQSIDIYREQGFLLGGLMLIGMALFKWGVLSGARSRRFYLLLMLGGYGLALILRLPPLLDILDSQFNPYTLLNQFTTERLFSQLPLVLGHIGLLGLLYSFVLARRLLYPFGLVGRMALTHYIGQTLFSILFFFGFGLAIFGELERYQLALLCLGFGAAQILFSLWWLDHFRHGPLEWAWRAATRWEAIPLRLTPRRQLPPDGDQRAGA